ncbi:RNA-protein complex protein Nop10 [Candidatus Thorarchaeota archaeon]|nr:MAG: RNA-protein complex protein Nop10 [Candidatus Thorarchaeota archaeon]
MPYIFKCSECGEYTLDDETCPKCGGSVKTPHPPRFSPVDKYGEYRRRAKRKQRED